MNNNDFKYFVKIEKAFEEQNEWYVQGVASGTLEDKDDERVSKDALVAFVSSINQGVADGKPMKLTDSHPRAGAVLGDLGDLVYAELLPDENSSLFIKARLDKDNPATQFMVRKIQKGKRYSFSIEGKCPNDGAATVWSDRLKKFITEYVKIVPKAISITTEPSYLPSFLEVVSKSYKNSLDASFDSNGTSTENRVDNLSDSNDMPETKKVVEETETKPEETVEAKTEAKPVEKPEEKAEESASEGEKQTEAAEEPETPKEVEKSKKEGTDVKKAKRVIKEEYKKVTNEDEEKSDESEGEAPAEPVKKEEMPETEEEGKDEGDGDGEGEGEGEAETEENPMQALIDAIADLTAKVDALVESDKQVHSEMGKSYKETSNVLKSFHEDIETLKEMPLQKKSRVAVSKSFDDRKIEEPKATSFKDVVTSFTE